MDYLFRIQQERHEQEQALHPVPILWTGNWEKAELKEPEVVVEPFTEGPYR